MSPQFQCWNADTDNKCFKPVDSARLLSVWHARCTKDANGNITTYSYDSHGRLTQVHSPDGGQLTKTYTSSDPLQVTTTRTMNASQSIVQTANVDGFGRSAQTILASAPGGQMCTETYYDAAGNIRAVNDPNTSCPSPPAAL